MKLLGKSVDKDGKGYYKLEATEEEDMWHFYHLIGKADTVTATTIRRVQRESNTGSVTSDRVRLKMRVIVDAIDFDPVAGTLRLKGSNTTDTPHCRIGASHTLELAVSRPVTIEKECWDAVAVRRIKEACDPTRGAEVAALIMQPGLAHLCIITPTLTLTRAHIELAIPRKRGGGSVVAHDRRMERFFELCLEAVARHVRFEFVKVVLVASPGFTRDEFLKYLFAQAVRRGLKVITENRHMFLSIHASSGHKHALHDVLQDPVIQAKLSDTKAAREVATLDEFYAVLRNDPDRAFYGPGHVAEAAERDAIAKLLISDELLRAASVAKRKQYLTLMDRVREGGGESFIFSSFHVSGERLQQLSGIAAILRYPIVDIDLVVDEDEDDEEEEAEEDAAEDRGADELEKVL